jgi:hypothetical protein
LLARRRLLGWRCGRRSLVANDVHDDLEAQLAVVSQAAEEPPPPGLVQLDGVVVGGPLTDRVALPVALSERLAVHLHHRVIALGVIEHCMPHHIQRVKRELVAYLLYVHVGTSLMEEDMNFFYIYIHGYSTKFFDMLSYYSNLCHYSK